MAYATAINGIQQGQGNQSHTNNEMRTQIKTRKQAYINLGGGIVQK